MHAFRLFEVHVDRENDKGVFVAEQILNIFHGGLGNPTPFKKLPCISFEILGKNQTLSYLFRIQSEYADFFVQQLYAHYSGIVVEAIEPPLPEDTPLYIQENRLKEGNYFPIKNFLDLSGKGEKEGIDPHSSLTGTLSKTPPGVYQGLRIVFSPLPDKKWKSAAHQGIEIGKYPKFLKNFFHSLVNSPLYSILTILSYIWRLCGFILHGNTNNHTEKKEKSEAEARFDEKIQGAGFRVNVGFFSSQNEASKRSTFFRDMNHALNIFAHQNGNNFLLESSPQKVVLSSEIQPLAKKMIFSSRELAGLVHLPTRYVRTPGIKWITSKVFEPPSNLPILENATDVTPIGITNFRGIHNPFGILSGDRLRHMYVVGKTGMGKSTLLENMIYSDIMNGKGVGLIDPHGDLASTILACIPKHRTNDVILFDPSDQEFPVAFNMLGDIHADLRPIVAGGLVSIFKRLFHESWGPRLEHILRSTILSLLEIPDATILSVPLMLTHKSYRKKIVARLQDPLLKKFWESEFEAMSPTAQTEAAGPILNKVGQFLSYSLTRNILGQARNPFSLRWIMDNKKIFIVNLSKGKIGEDTSMLLGSMLVTKFQIEAMTRADIPEKDRVEFSLYVDEFQNFATESFATILSEARKYRLSLVMANQYIDQMNDQVRDAVFGNVGSILSFQVGPTDAPLLSKVFNEEIVSTNDLLNLPKYNILTKLLVEGMPTQVFSATTFPSILHQGAQTEQRTDVLLKVSREKYAKGRAVVEKKIQEFSQKVIDDERKMKEEIAEKKKKEKKE